MPRIAEGRPPAEPSSPGQKQRYQRILRAAAEHGSRLPLDRVQMQEVAKDAGVAIATLYRYFPSKTHLFTALMANRVDRLEDLPVLPGTDAPAAVTQLLLAAGRELLRRPMLAQAMLTSNNAAVAAALADGVVAPVTASFSNLLLRHAGIEHPREHDLRLIRVIEQTWYGILISALNEHITASEAEADTLLACRRLLFDLGTDSASR